MMKLSNSVGFNSINKSSDVSLVQLLLNKARTKFPQFAAIQPEIKKDGMCGKKTIDCIENFQRKVLNYKYPDKKIDPGKTTWKKLNSNIGTVQQLGRSTISDKNMIDNFISWFSNTSVAKNMDAILVAFDKEMAPFLEIPKNKTPTKAKISKKSSLSKGSSTCNDGEGLPKITALRQGDSRWGKTLLGNSKSGSIHGYGCAMVCLTMSATYLGSKTKYWAENDTPEKLTPLIVNGILKKAGAFTANSLMLYIVGGAKALGMDGSDSGVGKKQKSTAISEVNQALKDGLVMAHVDYKKDWKGDHWILITGKNCDGSYNAIDPAYGKNLKLFTTPGAGKATNRHILLYGRGTSMSPKTPEKVKHYKVVRFVTLK